MHESGESTISCGYPDWLGVGARPPSDPDAVDRTGQNGNDKALNDAPAVLRQPHADER